VVDSAGITVDQMLGNVNMPGTTQDIATYMGTDAETGYNYFTLVTGNYPEFVWRGTAGFAIRAYDNGLPVPPPPSTDAPGAVFLDGRLTSSGTGTQDDPINNWDDAVAALATAGTQTIYIMGTVTVSASTTFSLSGADVVRSDTWNGALFRVTGGTVYFSGITIDGNMDNMGGTCVALIDARGGSLILGSGTILQNNLAGGGGGLRLLDSASAEMLGGAIIADNEVVNYGGGVGVFGYSTFTMSGGLIEENLADIRGDAVDVSDNGTFYWYGGALNPSSDRFSSGITVTVNDSNATFEINQAQAGSTSSIDGVIYLVDNAEIDVASGLSGLTLTIECEAPDLGDVVARAVTYTFDADDVDAFVYTDGSYVFATDDEITIYLIPN
jgi:hypothetical protein